MSGLKDPKALVRKYYKGCGTGVASMAPITAVQNSIALVLTKAFGDNPTLMQRTVAAYGAGWLSALVGSPSDLVILQRQNPLYSSETFADTIRRISSVKGLTTAYRGVSATGVRDGIFTAAYKTGSDALGTLLPRITANPTVDSVLYASLAGVIAAVLSHPADVISARMKSDLNASLYKNCWQTGMTVLQEEGVGALFKGLTPRAFRIMLAIPLLTALINKEIGTTLVEKVTN